MALLAMMTVGCNFPTVEFPGAALPEEVVISVPLREPTATPAPATPTPAMPTATPTAILPVVYAEFGLADPTNGESLILKVEGENLYVGKLQGTKTLWVFVVQNVSSVSFARASWVSHGGNYNGWMPSLIVGYTDINGETQYVEFDLRHKFH